MPNCENYIFPNTNLLDLTLYQYGREDCAPLQMFGPALRNHFLLHFVLSGTGSLQADGVIQQIHSGQAFLIVPGVPTTYYADEKNPWSYAWIEFDGLKAADYLARAGLSREHTVYQPPSGQITGLPSPQDQLLHMLKQHDETSLYLISCLYRLLDSLIKYSRNERKEHPGNLKDFYMKEAVHYIEAHYSEDISIEALAAWCGLNRTYFSKLFKDSLGITPQEFLLRYRMTRACDLLSKTSIPIAEVAASVGYANPLHFSRAFKNRYGCPPRAWRSSNRI